MFFSIISMLNKFKLFDIIHENITLDKVVVSSINFPFHHRSGSMRNGCGKAMFLFVEKTLPEFVAHCALCADENDWSFDAFRLAVEGHLFVCVKFFLCFLRVFFLFLLFQKFFSAKRFRGTTCIFFVIFGYYIL